MPDLLQNSLYTAEVIHTQVKYDRSTTVCSDIPKKA